MGYTLTRFYRSWQHLHGYSSCHANFASVFAMRVAFEIDLTFNS